MKFPKAFLLVIVLLLGFAQSKLYAASPSREDRERTVSINPDWNDEIKAAVVGRQVICGMNSTHVVAAWGEPFNVITHDIQGMPIQYWMYRNDRMKNDQRIWLVVIDPQHDEVQQVSVGSEIEMTDYIEEYSHVISMKIIQHRKAQEEALRREAERAAAEQKRIERNQMITSALIIAAIAGAGAYAYHNRDYFQAPELPEYQPFIYQQPATRSVAPHISNGYEIIPKYGNYGRAEDNSLFGTIGPDGEPRVHFVPGHWKDGTYIKGTYVTKP